MEAQIRQILKTYGITDEVTFDSDETRDQMYQALSMNNIESVTFENGSVNINYKD